MRNVFEDRRWVLLASLGDWWSPVPSGRPDQFFRTARLPASRSVRAATDQFDIERGRPATLVIVPEHITNWPRVLSIPMETLREVALVLARVGERLNESEEAQTG
jgi:hypothetical protein